MKLCSCPLRRLLVGCVTNLSNRLSWPVHPPQMLAALTQTKHLVWFSGSLGHMITAVTASVLLQHNGTAFHTSGSALQQLNRAWAPT